MRCKKHLTDFSSSVGVCASCLRERLCILVAAHAPAQAQEDRRKSDAHHPPPLLFPRSVSPYICRQNSDSSACNHHRQNLKDQLFFSTPQVGPTRGGIGCGNSQKKEKSTRFSLFSRLFRSKSKKTDSDLNCGNSSTASTSSGSWFSTMLSGHRKKQSMSGFDPRIGRNGDRGMSPARVSDYGDEAEWFDGSSGYSSASSQSWWQTPRRRRGGGRLNHPGNNPGMTFCLGPLVRASPNRQWNQKGIAPEIAFSGEIRVPVNLSTAARFCSNRSRKLADFGRFNHNH